MHTDTSTQTFGVGSREQLNLCLFEFQRSLGKLLERLLRERETGKGTPVKQQSRCDARDDKERTDVLRSVPILN